MFHLLAKLPTIPDDTMQMFFLLLGYCGKLQFSSVRIETLLHFHVVLYNSKKTVWNLFYPL